MHASRRALRILSRYWPRSPAPVARLPIPAAAPGPGSPGAPGLTLVALPDWALAISVDGTLLVPSHAVQAGDGPEWRRTDWWAAAVWFADCEAERAFEAVNGPIHSNSFRLRGWDGRMWDHAWANRIALFLRAWATREAPGDAAGELGPLPDAELVLTHDVDAVSKTAAIRAKQGAFNVFKAFRHLRDGRVGRAGASLAAALRFGLAPDDYWGFPAIRALERRAAVASHFNVFGGWRQGRSRLFDPGYDVMSPRISAELRSLAAEGCVVGLHPSHGAWRDAGRIAAERAYLERALGQPVRSLRQHWLRFSFADTWRAQQGAGLTLDTTLGFNDRPGFRNGAALDFLPLDSQGQEIGIRSVPLMLMDSHLYDYQAAEPQEVPAAIDRWLAELRTVRGVASVVWHVQAFGRDYGWAGGYAHLLAAWSPA